MGVHLNYTSKSYRYKILTAKLSSFSACNEEMFNRSSVFKVQVFFFCVIYHKPSVQIYSF
jgi:hypothetical protein